MYSGVLWFLPYPHGKLIYKKEHLYAGESCLLIANLIPIKDVFSYSFS